MNLKERINKILNLDKFNNLNEKQKSIISDCIFANCLILSKKNQDKYLQTIEEHVTNIDDLGDGFYYEDDTCYEGIVIHKVSTNTIDEDGFIFPINYEVKYKLFNTPLIMLTRSSLHEFGHVVVKRQNVNIKETKQVRDNVQIDWGGLVISNGITEGFGYAFTEIINEFTTLLSFKANLSYNEWPKESDDKMNEYAQRMGMTYEKKSPLTGVLPTNLFVSYTEKDLSKDKRYEMFNSIYVKYTPLVRLIMRSFQSPLFAYEDLIDAFNKGEGLSATKDEIPINDLLYGYYESSFRTEEVFDEIMSNDINWESLCKEFDQKYKEISLDNEFIEKYLDIFNKFYEKRNAKYLEEGLISSEKYNQNISDFNIVLNSCKNYYGLESKNKSL